MEACLIVTYRCNARCAMCLTWRNPSQSSEEFSPDLLERIPQGLRFINITGGEPFIRTDLARIVEIALTRSKRVVISTNGFFTDRVLALASTFGDRVGFRISLEGLPAANDDIRGMRNGFDHALRTIVGLRDQGVADIGFGTTVSDRNAGDLAELHGLAEAMGLEYATAATHNSFYFHKNDNTFDDPGRVAAAFENLARRMLRSRSPKKWFRAYFNMGLANKALGGERPLPCEAGSDLFFLDPRGNVLPCNGSQEPMIMGNLHQQTFDDIWNGERAGEVREEVRGCTRQCWMIGSAAPAMKKRVRVPAAWVLRNKLRLHLDRLRGRPERPLESVGRCCTGNGDNGQ